MQRGHKGTIARTFHQGVCLDGLLELLALLFKQTENACGCARTQASDHGTHTHTHTQTHTHTHTQTHARTHARNAHTQTRTPCGWIAIQIAGAAATHGERGGRAAASPFATSSSRYPSACAILRGKCAKGRGAHAFFQVSWSLKKKILKTLVQI